MTAFGKTVIFGTAVLLAAGIGLYFYFRAPAEVPEVVEEEIIETEEAKSDVWAGFEYIRPVDWPPVAQVVIGPFECLTAGEETARAGRTEPRVIDGREWCVTKVSEGAAGSVYTQYAYATEREDGRVIIFTWTSRAPQCANYDELESVICEEEKESFNADSIFSEWLQSEGVPD